MNGGLLEDKRFLRTLAAFVYWRKCPRKLTHDDAPKTAYTQELEAQQRPTTVRFLIWLLETLEGGGSVRTLHADCHPYDDPFTTLLSRASCVLNRARSTTWPAHPNVIGFQSNDLFLLFSFFLEDHKLKKETYTKPWFDKHISPTVLYTREIHNPTGPN